MFAVHISAEIDDTVSAARTYGLNNGIYSRVQESSHSTEQDSESEQAETAAKCVSPWRT